MKRTMLMLFSFSSILFYTACKKDAGSTNLKVKLTDAPAAYDEVNVDIQEINIKMEGDSSEWIALPTAVGIYNLLEYQDGVDTLIADAVLTGSKIKEIRLVLGSQNTITVAGETFPLTIPSGSESGLKIKMNKTLNGGVDYLTLDFDAALSIKAETGGYKLRPVVRILP